MLTFMIVTAVVLQAPASPTSPAPADAAPTEAAVGAVTDASGTDVDNSLVLSRPTEYEVIGAYPAAGYHAGRSGVVRVSCVIGPGGDLKTCKILSEAPKRFNFGWAALAVAFKFKFKTTMKDGTPSEGHEVAIPINFIYDKYAQDKAASWKKSTTR